jgi:hypothetical protein
MSKHRRNYYEKRPFLFIFFIILILPSLACQVGQQVETNEGTEADRGKGAVATAVAGISDIVEGEEEPEYKAGETRAKPLPPGTSIKEGQWSIDVVEIERGEAAWQAVHLANPNNQLPPDGWEYLNVKLRIKNHELSSDESSFPYYVTGDNRVKYASYDFSVVSPEPALDTYIPGRTESEGWDTILIHENEDNLMFVFEDLESYDDPPIYLAIKEGASVTVDEEMLLGIARTDFGTTQDQPVPFGQTATGEDWQLIVLDVIKGEAAWEKIIEENQFNDPPEAGMEYIMAKLRIRYIGLNEHGQYIRDDAFSIRTNSGNEFETPSLVEPEPDLDFDLYPGGEAEGWVVLTAPEKTKDLALFFSPDASGANDRYLSLGQGR